MWRQLRTVLMGPVLVTVAVPALLLLAVGGSIQVATPLHWVAVAVGAVLIVAGLAMLTWTISLFHRVGQGTLSPTDPTRALVVTGPYRHVRNPMFTGALAILLGEAFATRSPVLLGWLVVFFAFLAVVIPRSEEPRLARRFGDAYVRYRDGVPRWVPRLRPWRPEVSETAHSGGG